MLNVLQLSILFYCFSQKGR